VSGGDDYSFFLDAKGRPAASVDPPYFQDFLVHGLHFGAETTDELVRDCRAVALGAEEELNTGF
jgi:hypothetical protein